MRRMIPGEADRQGGRARAASAGSTDSTTPGRSPAVPRLLLAWAIGLPFFVWYAWGPRDLPWGDGAELAAGIRLLAPVHAPGYPIHLLLGRLLCAVFEPVRAAVILSAAGGALAVGATAAAGAALAGSAAAGAAGAFVLALAPQFVQAASGAEVYGLALGLLAAAIAAAVRGAPPGLTGLALGLACAAHTSTVLVAPFVAWYAAHRCGRGSLRSLAAGLAAGLAVFVALLARGLSDPLTFQWPAVRSAGDLVETVAGGRFRAWVLAAPPAEVGRRTFVYAALLIANLSIIGTPLAVIGARALRRPEAVLVGGLAVPPILHALTYGARDAEVGLLPALVPLALLVAAGAARLARAGRWGDDGRVGLAAGVALSSAVAWLVFGSSPAGPDRSLPRDFAEAVAGLPLGARVYAHWKRYAPIRYLQTVEGKGTHVDLWYAEPGGPPERIATRRADGTSRPDSGPLGRPSPGVFFTWIDAEIGALGPLVPHGAVWRLEAEVPLRTITYPRPKIDARPLAPGVDLLQVDRIPLATRGRPFTLRALWGRGADAAGSPLLRAALRHAGADVAVTDVLPLYAHLPPERWDADAVYAEAIPFLPPTSAPRGWYDVVLLTPDGGETNVARVRIR